MTNQRLKEVTAELNKTTSSDIVGVGYGFKTVNGKSTSDRTIVFTVIRKKPLSEIPEEERIPSEITIDGETFSTDVIEGTITPFAYGYCDPSFYNWQGTPPSNRNTHRPLMGGISVTNHTALGAYVGTMGFIAVDNDTNTLVGVSNNHVLSDDAFYTSDRDPLKPRTNVFDHSCIQPNELGNSDPLNEIGKVKRYEPISPIPFNNEVDGALISLQPQDKQNPQQGTIDPGVSWIQHGITGMTSAPRFATTQELDTIFENPAQEYYTAGRTTGAKGQGVTKLFCTANSTSIAINYSRQGLDTTCYMNDTFELQASGLTTPTGDWCYYPSAGGDSGSAILTQIEGEFVIVGLLYGGRQIPDPDNPEQYLPIATLCNRIDNVASALNISAWNGNFQNYAANAPQVYIHQGLSTDKFKIINGVKHYQLGLVSNSTHPFDPTPQPTATAEPTPTGTPLPPPTPTPTATPEPTGVIDPTPTATEVPPTGTPSPTSTPAPQTFYLNYDHLNSCSTANLILSINGVQHGSPINLSQGSTSSGTLRGPITVYPGDQISLQYKPFNLISPCTLSYQNPIVEVFLNGVSVGTNSNDSLYSTYNYTVQSGVNPTLLVEMNSFSAPTPTPVPTYILTLQNVTSETYAHECAKGYITVEKNGSVVATLTKTQGETTASWNASSISFTSSDVVTMKSYSQGGGGSGCATTDTTVRCVYNGSAKTSSSLNTGTNGQSFTIPDENGTAFGWFFEVGGI
jgi:hypothetical protein